jgi:zinc transporter ZupT
MLGTLGGMVGYVFHASNDGWFFQDSPFMHALTDAGLGALAGSLLFAAVSAACNRLRRRP